jgi:hypothetical protein
MHAWAMHTLMTACIKNNMLRMLITQIFDGSKRTHGQKKHDINPLIHIDVAHVLQSSCDRTYRIAGKAPQRVLVYACMLAYLPGESTASP